MNLHSFRLLICFLIITNTCLQKSPIERHPSGFSAFLSQVLPVYTVRRKYSLHRLYKKGRGGAAVLCPGRPLSAARPKALFLTRAVP